MNNKFLQLFISLLVFILLLFCIFNYSIKNKKFTCNKYILNTYLYILLTINIVSILLLTLEYKNINFTLSLAQLLGIFLLTIASIIFIHSISPKNIVLKHLIWVIFILLLSVSFYPMYRSYDNQKNAIVTALLTTLIIFIGLSFVAFIKPELISLSWGPVLLILLLTGILVEFFSIFFYRKTLQNKNRKSLPNIFKILSYIFIVIFMVFILYDTKRLQINAKNCVQADYIQESLGLFLDIFNIFVRLLGLSRR